MVYWQTLVSGRYCPTAITSSFASCLSRRRSAAACWGEAALRYSGVSDSMWLLNQGSSLSGPRPCLHGLAPLSPEFFDRGGRTVAGQVLHGAMIQIGDDFRLPAVPNIGTDCAQVARRQHVKHLQQIGRADLHGQIDGQLLVGRVAAKRQVVHQSCACGPGTAGPRCRAR